MWYHPLESQANLQKGISKNLKPIKETATPTVFQERRKEVPYFSDRSDEKLMTCDERLQRVCRTVIQFYDCSVIHGHRGEQEQNEIFRSGYSKHGYPDSKHNLNPSSAVDLAPYPINWKDTRRFYILAGYMLCAAHLLGIGMRWGGDWDGDDDLNDQKFNDLGHFELVQRKEGD